MTAEQMERKMEFLSEQKAALTAQLQMLAERQARTDKQIDKLAEVTARNAENLSVLITAQNEIWSLIQEGFEETRFAINKLMDVIENSRDRAIELDKRVKRLEDR